ncbi:Uncharacterised protein [Starkeya nomas]|uniref:DUF192 domain-containing protein n=2 Tax=Xanthobacteraceae TaxID=335928 RepID=A0A5S9NJX6_9HYPH|nr:MULTISPECIES: DUF192 domain-containing protein [Xanthobacteraceae]TSJ61609.1 DUF192 domain-containing protein [Ancylobacter moscoviensis]CAA0090933.1 Uncharacterised protein [Starkeya nomas]
MIIARSVAGARAAVFPHAGLLRQCVAGLAAVTLLFAALLSAQAASFEKLTVSTKAGPVVFEVELAVTPAERSKGLMYRTELAPNAGMLFDFGVDQPVYMWMKNTYLPLDMVFIRSDGRVASIAANTVPLSTATISSGAPVRAVLELPAGTAKARGIAVGDRIEHRLFAGG